VEAGVSSLGYSDWAWIPELPRTRLVIREPEGWAKAVLPVAGDLGIEVGLRRAGYWEIDLKKHWNESWPDERILAAYGDAYHGWGQDRQRRQRGWLWHGLHLQDRRRSRWWARRYVSVLTSGGQVVLGTVVPWFLLVTEW